MKWFIFFLTLPHFKPSCLEYLWPIMDIFFDIGRIISVVIIFFVCLLKKKVPSKPVWILAIMYSWVCILTYFNDGNLWSAVITFISVISVALIVDLFAKYKETIIGAFMFNFECLIYLNLLSILVGYPEGIYTRDIGGAGYFLGYRTGFLYYSLLAICVAVLYAQIFQKRLRSIILVLASYACVFITWSAASVGALIIIAILFFSQWTQIRRWLTFPKIFISSICVDLVITVFRITDRLVWAVWIIETVLKRQITFTGRTFIWDQAMSLIIQHPILGYGAVPHIYMWGRSNHAHNQYFELILDGGIILLVLFLLFNLMIGRQLIKHRRDPNVYYFLILLTGLYIVFITEVLEPVPGYMLFMIAYHVDKFCVPALQKFRRKRKIYVQNSKIPQKH